MPHVHTSTTRLKEEQFWFARHQRTLLCFKVVENFAVFDWFVFDVKYLIYMHTRTTICQVIYVITCINWCIKLAVSTYNVKCVLYCFARDKTYHSARAP